MSNLQKISTTKVLSFPLPDLDLVRVEGHQAGESFKMGLSEQSGRALFANIHFDYSFYMSEFPVTQRLYELVMEKNPSDFKGDLRPVEKVYWDDTKLFLSALEKRKEIMEFKKTNGFSDYVFRLPSEAEWEYAALGGIHSQGYEYAGSDDLKQVGWYRENSGQETKPVGLLLPNELGLYDLNGNIDEWCEDESHHSQEFNSEERPLDGSAWADDHANTTNSHIVRGGRFSFSAKYCRLTHRTARNIYDNWGIGFRLVFSHK